MACCGQLSLAGLPCGPGSCLPLTSADSSIKNLPPQHSIEWPRWVSTGANHDGEDARLPPGEILGSSIPLRLKSQHRGTGSCGGGAGAGWGGAVEHLLCTRPCSRLFHAHRVTAPSQDLLRKVESFGGAKKESESLYGAWSALGLSNGHLTCIARPLCLGSIAHPGCLRAHTHCLGVGERGFFLPEVSKSWRELPLSTRDCGLGVEVCQTRPRGNKGRVGSLTLEAAVNFKKGPPKSLAPDPSNTQLRNIMSWGSFAGNRVRPGISLGIADKPAS